MNNTGMKEFGKCFNVKIYKDLHCKTIAYDFIR